MNEFTYHDLTWSLYNGATLEHLGYLPDFLDERDPRPAQEQFDANYVSGWSTFGQGTWQLVGEGADAKLRYPGDPPMRLLASTKLREEEILVFTGGPWVVIKQPNGDFVVSRMD